MRLMVKQMCSDAGSAVMEVLTAKPNFSKAEQSATACTARCINQATLSTRTRTSRFRGEAAFAGKKVGCVQCRQGFKWLEPPCYRKVLRLLKKLSPSKNG